MVDLKLYEDNYFINMDTIEYKLKKGAPISINPILLKDYNRYNWAKEVLEIEKNKYNDANAISMSYLKFLINVIFKNNSKLENDTTLGELYQSKLWWIFKMCTNEENIVVNDNKIIILDANKNVKSIISAKEFDDISKIILAYNDVNYDDREISDEIRKLAEKYFSIKYKGTKSPSLEKKKAFVSSKMGKSFKELNMLTYREFQLICDSLLKEDYYFTEKMIQCSYKFDYKEDVIHPLYKEDKDIYEEIFTETEVLEKNGLGSLDLT